MDGCPIAVSAKACDQHARHSEALHHVICELSSISFPAQHAAVSDWPQPVTPAILFDSDNSTPPRKKERKKIQLSDQYRFDREPWDALSILMDVIRFE